MNDFKLEPSPLGLERYGTLEAADGERFTASRVKRFWLSHEATYKACYLEAELYDPHQLGRYFALIVAFGVESEAEAVETAGDWLAERGLIATPQTVIAKACDCGQNIETTWWTFCPCCGDEVRRYTILERKQARRQDVDNHGVS